MSELFSPGLALTDESFDPADAGNYDLALIFGEEGAAFCILDTRRNKFITIHEAVRSAPKPGSPDPGWNGFFRELVDEYPWLKSPFRQVKLGFDGFKATLVPATLFDASLKEDYLAFNFSRTAGEEVHFDHLPSLDACQVYAIPGALHETVTGHFQGIRVAHMASVLIESIRINYKNRISSPRVFLHLRRNLFDIMIFDGRQLTCFNTFPFHNPEDVTYYLIFVMEQLGLNPEEVPVVLLGRPAGEAGLETLLMRYVRHVEPGRRNDSYKYSYLMNQLPPYAFYPLFNLFSCGL